MSTKIPENLKYTKEHEWIVINGNLATVGITDFAQNALGDIVFVELPEKGATVTKDQSFGVVESIKSVSDIYSPVSGKIIDRNEDLISTPDLCNKDAYEAWMVKIELSNPTEINSLLNANSYKEQCHS